MRGAGGRTRTPDLLITNQLLYRLSYTSMEKELMATTKGLEPSTSGVTGRRSNQLNYMAVYPGSTYGYPGQPTGPWAQVSLIKRGAGSWD